MARRPRRALRHGPGRHPGRRPLPRASCASTRGRRRRSPPSSSTRPTRRAASRAGSRSRPSGRCRSTGPSTCSPTATGATALREYMRDYNHWTTLGVLCELLPQPENRVTLADERDEHGMPVARFDYTQCENDKANIASAPRMLERIWEAAGAQDTLTIDRYAHLVGGCRMGTSPENSVVDADHRVWGVDEPLRLRRQRDAHAGGGEPRADDHGAGLAAGRAPGQSAGLTGTRRTGWGWRRSALPACRGSSFPHIVVSRCDRRRAPDRSLSLNPPISAAPRRPSLRSPPLR